MAVKIVPALIGLVSLFSMSSFTPVQPLPHRQLSPENKVASGTRISLKAGAECAAQQKAIDNANRGINALRDVYKHTLGYSNAEEVHLEGRYFCSRQAYENYKRKLGSRSSSSTGFFSRYHREIVVMGARPEQGLQTLMHEASHALLRSRDANYSKWLNEGLAEYFEGASWDNSRFTINPQRTKDRRMKQMLSQGKLPRLSTYLGLTNRQWTRLQKPAPVGSSVAWSLVYFLMENPQHHGLIRQVIRDERKGISAGTSLAKRYPGGVKALEREWHQFIRGRRQAHDWQRFA